MNEWFKKVAEKVATFFMRGDLGASWDSQCRLGGILERLVGDSEPSWERLGSALERLRTSWGFGERKNIDEKMSYFQKSIFGRQICVLERLE